MKKIMVIFLIISILIVPMSVMANEQGKNLFDSNGTWYYGSYTNGIVQANTGLSNIATFPVTLTNANRSIFRVYFCKENTSYTVSIYNFDSTDINVSLVQYQSIESAASYENALVSTNAAGKNNKITLTTVSGGNILLVAISGDYVALQTDDIIINEIGLIQLEYGTVATEYEPYIPDSYNVGMITNELFIHIKNLAVAISKTLKQFFYDGNGFTSRGYLFFAYVATVFCLSILGIIFRRR